MRLRSLMALVALLPCVGFAAPSDDMKSLIDQGRAAEAYDLGKKTEHPSADAAFDYYFGIAAVDSGRLAEGVEALKRYVDRHPDEPRARLELARGYFLLGENRRSEEEFEAVKKTSPPREVEDNINVFLTAIRQREESARPSISGYLEAGAGYDSNANSGVSNSNIILPTLGNVLVDQSGTRASSSFGRMAAGAHVVSPLSGGFGLFADAGYDARHYSTAPRFDQTNYGAGAGVDFSDSQNLVRVGLSSNTLEVDRNRFRDIRGLTAEWQHRVTSAQTVFVAGQSARFYYSGANDARNADFAALGAGFRHVWDATWQPGVTVSVNASREKNNRQRDDLSNDRFALRAAVDFKPRDSWLLLASVAYLPSRYYQPDPLLGETRRDEYYSLDCSISYFVTRAMSIRMDVSVAENHSNLALFAFRRSLASVNVRYNFR